MKSSRHSHFVRYVMKVSFTQLLLSMLLTGLAQALPVSAQELGKRPVTLKADQQPIGQVLAQIKRIADVHFVYSPEVIQSEKRISLSVRKEPLANVMDMLCRMLNISWDIMGGQIILKKGIADQTLTDELPISLLTSGATATHTISGKVVDGTTNEPLPGVSIVIKGTNRGTTTGPNGTYSLTIPDETPTLLFSYVGYLTQEVTVSSTQTVLNTSLSPDPKTLGEVVVVGYGNQRKRELTSSVASVKMETIDQGAVYDPVKMLQGRATGVNVMSPSGRPGEKPIVMVRGVSSISGSGSPLYVIDGVPNETLPNLNPNDIETMDVLKDASAAAIYGSRANSGVIIITTKAGTSGKTLINVSARTGFSTIFNDIEMANSTQYAEVMQAAVNNYNTQRGTSLQFYQPPVIEETDWMKAISRSSARTNAWDISANGGNDRTKFFTSFGHFKQEGILQNSQLNQYNFRLNMSHQLNNFVKLNANLSGSYARQNLLEETSTALKVVRTAREEQPWYSPYLPDGSYRVSGTHGLLRHNPVMLINEEIWTEDRYEGIGRLSLDVTPIKGLKYTPSISAYGTLIDEKKKLTEQMAARSQSAGWGAIAQDKNMGLRYLIDNILTYTGQYNKLAYTALVGHSFEKYSYDRFGAYSDNYRNGAFPSSNFDVISAGPNIYPSASIGYNAYALESYLGRVSLDYDDKYLFNASVRRDGSSKFSKDRKYGTFPSASIGWRITKEAFMPTSTALSDLKIRASWGITGSLAGIGFYAPLSLINAGGAYNGQGGFVLAQDAQNVTWEKGHQVNVGFDAELWRGRISLTADYFHQRTTDLLYNRPIYATSGYTTIAANIGTVQNRGVEMAINTKVLTGALKWNVGLNITTVNNRLLSLINNTEQYIVPPSGSSLLGGTAHILANGHPISSFYMHRQTGIYQYDNEVPDKLRAKGVRAGDVIYEDLNGDGDITDIDRSIVGKAIPDFYGGFNSALSWKGFELNVFGQYSVGNKLLASWQGVNSTEGTDHLGNALGSLTVEGGKRVEQFFNIRKAVAETYWRGPGTSNTTPRPIRQGAFTGYPFGYNHLTSTRFLEDASYLKLRTLTLAYNLPAIMTKKLRIQGLRIYGSIDNFLTFTRYSGYDPEASFATAPGDPNYGIDFGLQPSLRTFLMGLNLKF